MDENTVVLDTEITGTLKDLPEFDNKPEATEKVQLEIAKKAIIESSEFSTALKLFILEHLKIEETATTNRDYYNPYLQVNKPLPWDISYPRVTTETLLTTTANNNINTEDPLIGKITTT